MRFKSENGRDVTKRTIIYVSSIVSGWTDDILTSTIAQMLTSRPILDLCIKTACNGSAQAVYKQYIIRYVITNFTSGLGKSKYPGW